jgi:DNA-binding SARP family transcriptional activator
MFLLRTFGGLALERNGSILDPLGAQRKALALLAVLTTARANGVGREKLMALLWPESDAERARRALNQMLHSLRRQLGSQEAILGTAELRLNPACVESDARCFQDAFEAGNTEAAVALYRGPFLDGVHLDGTPDFDAWIEQQRGELQRSYQNGLECLAQQAEGCGDWRSAVGWWQRLQAADPLNSRVAICLMLALESSGERAAALQHARIHELLLRDDWGILPDTAVAELAERLRTAGTSPSSPFNRKLTGQSDLKFFCGRGFD